jgi:type II secretion system protein F
MCEPQVQNPKSEIQNRKVPEFSYQAMDRAGTVVTGRLQAESLEATLERVRQMDLFPMEVAPAAERNGARKAEANGKVLAGSVWSRVSRMDVVVFTRQLADLVTAGLPLDRALTVLIRQSEAAGMRARLAKVQEEVRSGQSLSDALARFPREFPSLFVNMVHAGEATGQLGTVLERLAGYLEREMTRRAQLLAALTYPAVLIFVAVSAVVFLLTYVVPQLSSVFEEAGQALPLPTLLLLGIVGFLRSYWWQLLLGAGVTAAAARQALATPAGRAAWDAWTLRLPLLGKLSRRVIASRFLRSLGTMLAGGVPILDSLEITRDAVGNASAARAVDRIREAVRQGESLADAMERTGFFLPVAMHMAAVGEETGRLPVMLIRTADSLDFEIDNQMRRLLSLIEPVIVVLMGVFVGFIVLSILLPIFDANLAVAG